MSQPHPFGQRLRERRLARLATDPAFTLRRLAGRLGIQPSYLSRLERGAAPSLSEDNIQALARELGDDPDILLALAGKLPADVRQALLAAPGDLLPLVRGLVRNPALAPGPSGQLWQSYRESQHLARVGSFVRDLATGEDSWSEEFFRIFGLPPDAPTPTFESFMALVHPEDQPVVAAVRARLMADDGPVQYAYRFRRGDGLWRHAKAVARCERGPDGRARRIHGTVQDVTTERQALNDLRSVAQFPEANPNIVLRLARDGRLTYANQASAGLLESAGLAVGEPAPQALAAAVGQALDTGRESSLELPDGENIQQLTVVPDNTQAYVNCYGRDVTAERALAKRVEAVTRELAETRASLDAVLEACHDGVVLVRADGVVLRGNAAMARALGRSGGPKTLPGLHRTDVFGPQTAPTVERDDLAVMASGEPQLLPPPMNAVVSDGTTRSLQISRAPLRDADGRVAGFCAITRDSTEWQEAAEALADSRARHQRFFDDAVLGVFRTTAEGRMLAVNPALARLFGYASPEAMLAEMGDDVSAGFAEPEKRRDVVRRLTSKEGLLDFENVYRRRDGTTFIGALHARMTVTPSGERLIEGFVEDISERKRIAAELAASEERLKTHLRNFPLPTFTFAKRGRDLVLADANKAAEALFRGRIGAMVGSPAEAVFADAPDIYLTLWSAFEGRRGDRRALALRPPGAAEPGLFDMTFVFVAPDTVMLHAEEVTALAKMRESLQRTSDQLRSILDHVPCAVYFKDPAGRCIMVNRAVSEAFGLPDAPLTDLPGGSIHEPETAVRIADDDRRILASGQAETFEEDVLVQGRPRRFLTTKTPLLDEHGQPYALCGMSLDITEQVELARSLQSERDTLGAILDHVPYAAVLVTSDGDIVYLNKRSHDLLGYSHADIPTAEVWMRRAYPDDGLRARVMAEWLAVQGKPCRRVYPVRCGDGRSRWIDFVAAPLAEGRMLLTINEADPRQVAHLLPGTRPAD
ncbi:MAG: PAS domain S-box [Solidesulfovibrio magneticus str. Maddingley MBC34]|uniref:histidine kinase n=1 Tax=Solidesulfovibrio magneticus str. Maddingley MBC34 TaxID=1206767 RepID=K6GMW2_9BACT|nr:MAG: PAS domain S-box [Solidesulfovibrio magneticus str. Maddingley MBC34]